MIKTLRTGVQVLKLSWEANGVLAVLSIVGHVYHETLYPFIQIFLLAQLLDIFAKNHSATFNNFLWIIEAYILATVINIFLSRLLDAKDDYTLERLNALLDRKIIKKLTELDPQTFEKPSFQSLLTQLEAAKGSLQSHLIKFTNL